MKYLPQGSSNLYKLINSISKQKIIEFLAGNILFNQTAVKVTAAWKTHYIQSIIFIYHIGQ